MPLLEPGPRGLKAPRPPPPPSWAGPRLLSVLLFAMHWTATLYFCLAAERVVAAVEVAVQTSDAAGLAGSGSGFGLGRAAAGSRVFDVYMHAAHNAMLLLVGSDVPLVSGLLGPSPPLPSTGAAARTDGG